MCIRDSPKAVIAYNLETEEFRSGQVDLPENFKQYIIKFKEADDSPTTCLLYTSRCV